MLSFDKYNVENIKPVALHHTLQFLYQGYTPITLRSASKMLAVADLFQIDELKVCTNQSSNPPIH